MIQGIHPAWQALLGTLMTWGLTALGAASAFCLPGGQRKLLDCSLGFAGGVMLAASYWSLLEPAIELARGSALYGSEGQYAFVPIAVGFLLGGLFVYAADVLLTYSGMLSSLEPEASNAKSSRSNRTKLLKQRLKRHRPEAPGAEHLPDEEEAVEVNASPAATATTPLQTGIAEDDGGGTENGLPAAANGSTGQGEAAGNKSERDARWRRIVLLVVAITVHNVPEGLAVGVGFGSIGKAETATFDSARNLAIGIGIQNFPEGLAVSLPLKVAGVSSLKSVWYGQLSGMVEPVSGVIGALLVSYIEVILPYALAFAAGAMVYVVIDDIVPEAQTCGNGREATWSTMLGFVIMMCLDLL